MLDAVIPDEAPELRLGALAAALQAGALPVCVRDSRGRYVAVNGAFAELVGLEADRLVGHSDHALQPPDVAARVAELDALVLDSGSHLDTREVVLAREGRRRVRACRFPVGDEGRPWAVCVILAPADAADAGRIERERLQAAAGHGDAAAFAQALEHERAAVAELGAGLESARGEEDALRVRVGELDARCAELGALLQEAREGRDRAEWRLGEVEPELAGIRDELARCIAERDAERHAAETERRRSAEAAEARDAERARRIETEGEVERQRARAAGADTELEAERARAAATDSELEAERRARAAADTELEAERRARAAIGGELDAERRGREALVAQLDAERHGSAALAAQLDAERHGSAALAAQLDAARDGSAALAAQLEAERQGSAALAAQVYAERDGRAAVAAQLEAERAARLGLAAELEAVRPAGGAGAALPRAGDPPEHRPDALAPQVQNMATGTSLAALAEAGWEAAALWRPQSDGVLTCGETWTADAGGLAAWERLAWGTPALTDGALAAAAADGHPSWHDTDALPACPRSRAAASAGLRTLVCVPVVDGAGRSLAVLEVARRDLLAHDPALIAGLADLAGRLSHDDA